MDAALSSLANTYVDSVFTHSKVSLITLVIVGSETRNIEDTFRKDQIKYRNARMNTLIDHQFVEPTDDMPKATAYVIRNGVPHTKAVWLVNFLCEQYPTSVILYQDEMVIGPYKALQLPNITDTNQLLHHIYNKRTVEINRYNHNVIKSVVHRCYHHQGLPVGGKPIQSAAAKLQQYPRNNQPARVAFDCAQKNTFSDRLLANLLSEFGQQEWDVTTEPETETDLVIQIIFHDDEIARDWRASAEEMDAARAMRAMRVNNTTLTLRIYVSSLTTDTPQERIQASKDATLFAHAPGWIVIDEQMPMSAILHRIWFWVEHSRFFPLA